MITLPTVALSLRQPWAFLVLNGKNIENRRWNTKFRGDFLLHAAIGMSRREYDDGVSFALDVDPHILVPAFETLQRGGIVGRARIDHVIPPCAKNLAHVDPKLLGHSCGHAWHMPMQHGFVLADVRPLPFVPYKGSLGFFRVADDLLAQLREAA